MVWQAYSTPSYLYFGDEDIIQSREGCQQGDPLGPLLFALGIRDLMNSCQSEVNIWYLDDATVCGDPETVMQDLTRIMAASNSLGLSVNTKKCEIFTLQGSEDPTGSNTTDLLPESLTILDQIKRNMPNIKTMHRNDLLLLGAPIYEEAADNVLLEKLEDLRRMGERLDFIDAQDAVFLLRNCYAIPKLTYFLRTAPTFKNADTLKLYDLELKKILEGILNIKMDDSAWDQSSLPVKKGGLGIRKATDLALPCFISSAYGASGGINALLPDYVTNEAYEDLIEAQDAWKAQFNTNREDDSEEDNDHEVEETPLPEDVTVQALWDQPVFEQKYQKLLNSAVTPSEKARLQAVASPHSSDWLMALPVTKLGLKIDNSDMQIACGLRLGIEMFKPFKCGSCGSIVDPTGRHGLSCKKAKGTYPRHLQVNDILARALGSAQVSATLEPTGLCRDGKQPDGRTLVPWKEGTHLTWDYTCHDTFCLSNVDLSAQCAGKAAEKAEKDKLTKYHELTRQFIVMPVANETLGSWAQDSLRFVEEIGSRITAVNGDKKSTSYLFQRISMAVQKFNVVSIKGAFPKNKTLHELSYL